MTYEEAEKLILNEAESSALGDNNKEVLEALEVFRRRKYDKQVDLRKLRYWDCKRREADIYIERYRKELGAF